MRSAGCACACTVRIVRGLDDSFGEAGIVLVLASACCTCR